uniref:TIL domain-containing protein n=1 Tax=Parascaris equorum TaxID=6256 RepID=A0A914RQ36_PAREQ
MLTPCTCKLPDAYSDTKVPTPCPLMCNPPSCECMASRGFRRDYWGNCIPRYQCPRRPGNVPFAGTFDHFKVGVLSFERSR